jgi:hypothetical protein
MMAKYDQGGGCSCGLRKICDCEQDKGEEEMTMVTNKQYSDVATDAEVKQQKPYYRPQFTIDLVITEPTMLTDKMGVAWWVDPGKRTMQRVFAVENT